MPDAERHSRVKFTGGQAESWLYSVGYAFAWDAVIFQPARSLFYSFCANVWAHLDMADSVLGEQFQHVAFMLSQCAPS